ncbi:MAG: hypothetical protein ACYC0V_02865 [Armatimonadota bacterium]
MFWSHDSKQIFYHNWQDPNLYTSSYRGGRSQVAVKGRGERFYYRLSPDGKHVAFIDGNRAYIATLYSAGKPIIIATGINDRLHLPAWSRDGKKLAVVGSMDAPGSTDTISRIHFYDVITRKQMSSITVRHDVAVLWWSNDGRCLIAKIIRGYNCEGLMTIPVTGGPSVVLKAPSGLTKGLDWHEGK